MKSCAKDDRHEQEDKIPVIFIQMFAWGAGFGLMIDDLRWMFAGRRLQESKRIFHEFTLSESQAKLESDERAS